MPVIEVNGLTKAFRTYKKQPGFAGTVQKSRVAFAGVGAVADKARRESPALHPVAILVGGNTDKG